MKTFYTILTYYTLVVQLIGLICLLNTPYCQGQSTQEAYRNKQEEIRFDHLSTQQGLSQSTVNSILQDSRGYMWFTTRDGLNKYDGYTFTVYKNNLADSSSLSANHTRDIVEDTASYILWIGTSGGGFNRFDPLTEKFTTYQHKPHDPNSLSDNNVSAICMDKSGNLWISTSEGLNLFNPKTEKFTRYFHNPSQKGSLSGNDVMDLLIDRTGKLWVATTKGLDTYDPQTNMFTPVVLDAPDFAESSRTAVIEIYEDQAGNLWLGMKEKGLIKYNPAIGICTTFSHDPSNPASLSGNNPIAVFEDSYGELWVGTWPGGLNKYNPATNNFTVYKYERYNPYSISDNYVRTIYQDKGGVLWIGTYNGGISIYDRLRNKFRLYTSNTSSGDVTNVQVHALLEDKQGNIWIGKDNCVERINKETGQSVMYYLDNDPSVKLTAFTVYSIVQDRWGSIWIATFGKGLGKFNSVTQTFDWYTHDSTDVQSISTNNITVVKEDKEGNLWMSTSDGLNKFDPLTERFTRYKPDSEYLDKDGAYSVSAITIGKSNIIWIASTRNGLASLDPATGTFTHYPYRTTKGLVLPHIGTFCLHEDSKGLIWISFHGNVLHHFNPKSGLFTPITAQEGLPTSQIRGILEDNGGNLWLSTRNDGIYKYDPVAKTSLHYNIYDGLQSNEFLGAFYKNAAGEMFFGGNHGFNMFHPEHLQKNVYEPTIAINSFKVFNTPKPLLHNQIKLNYKENFFSFDFVALSYSSTQKNTYEYKLEGVDAYWVKAGTRRYASYTNVSPGEYIFRVRAANSDGIKNEDGIAVRISIDPPVWQQPIVQLIFLLSGCMAGFVGYRTWIHNIKARNRHLENLVGHRTEELRHRTKQLEQSLLETQSQQQEAEHQRHRAEEANRLKTELMNLTVHDLKNPLGGILLYTDLIKESVQDPDKVTMLTQTIKQTTEDMFYLISNLLKRAKLESSFISLQKDTIDIALLVRNVVKRNRIKAVHKGQQLLFNETTGCYAEIDVDLMNDVLENLISNAIKFTPKGKNILIGVNCSHPVVTVCVKDEGLGMRKEEIGKLFAPFQRLSARPTGGETSTGLGLSIVKRIIDLHNGDIQAESEGPNQGSTFTVQLPMAVVTEPTLVESK